MSKPKQIMSEKVRRALSPALFRFYEKCMSQGHHCISAERAEVSADAFRAFFGLVCPMGTADTRTLLERIEYREVYLQPGLERQKHIRGHWSIQHNEVLILIDAARPDPSKIKTLLHEIAEMLLEISYSSNPETQPLDDQKREDWANKFAAFVKMPRDMFLSAYQEHGLDLPALSDIFAETLAGVSRHIRDLCMPEIPFYFGRVSLEHRPEIHCSDLVPYLEQNHGVCVYVADAAKSRVVDWRRRRGGALPVYNVGKKKQYRILHPRLRLYTLSDAPAEEPPMLISRLRAAAGGRGSSQLSLFDQDLAVMIFPICKKRRLNGFFIVGVHHSQICLFDQLRTRMCIRRQDDMDWVFSWEKEEYTRVADEMDDYSDQLDLTEYWEDDDLSEEEQARRKRIHWLVSDSVEALYNWEQVNARRSITGGHWLYKLLLWCNVPAAGTGSIRGSGNMADHQNNVYVAVLEVKLQLKPVRLLGLFVR